MKQSSMCLYTVYIACAWQVDYPVSVGQQLPAGSRQHRQQLLERHEGLFKVKREFQPWYVPDVRQEGSVVVGVVPARTNEALRRLQRKKISWGKAGKKLFLVLLFFLLNFSCSLVLFPTEDNIHDWQDRSDRTTHGCRNGTWERKCSPAPRLNPVVIVMENPLDPFHVTLCLRGQELTATHERRESMSLHVHLHVYIQAAHMVPRQPPNMQLCYFPTNFVVPAECKETELKLKLKLTHFNTCWKTVSSMSFF